MDTLINVGRGLLGIAAFIGIAYAFSSNKKAIPWRLVGVGMLLQLIFGLLVLQVDIVRIAVDAVGTFFVRILEFNRAGAEFLFGSLITNTQSFGYLFAFNVLPTIVFFSALTSLLFYLGILQKIVFAFAWVMTRTMKLSGPESLSASANIFLGQTEAPLLIRHYLPTMTRSELMAVMVGGMATIAGAVMVAYIGMLGGPSPEGQLLFAKHLLTASVLSAPAALLTAKILVPQTEEVNQDISVSREKIGSNALEAIANGTSDGLQLAINVGAMLLVFTAFVAMANWILSAGVGGWTGLNSWIASSTGGQYAEFTLQYIFGLLFAPVAWLMGIDYGQLMISGQIIGEKTILNEFYAYGTLAKVKDSGALTDVRAQIILTYALCGFSNIASVGIQIGGIGALAPNQRTTLAQLGMKALLGGSIACFLTACVASMMI
ncbi:MAG TPA: nucleoside transporter C-terminal domain-containing protein [Gemmatimonadaceae bacterium]|nr:nucleoside transporter C-terminal domain-containing protein [Gemmatimonadaceae bacterium]